MPSVPTTTSPHTTTTVATPTPSGEPKYGGTLSLAGALDIGIFDPAATGQFMGMAGSLVNESYLGVDWARGAAGSEEWDIANPIVSPDMCACILTESWDMPSLGTIIFKVRRGVNWSVNPKSEASRLMGGREVTPEDWVSNFSYYMRSPRSPIRIYAPQLIGTATLEKTGPWEVTLKTPIDPSWGWDYLAVGSGFYYLLPPEVIQKYGDMRDWRNVVGTGPFILTDFVTGSSATLVRNPGYWDKDSAGSGKGNRLPYLGGVKILVIPDVSTQLSALRTGKIDTLSSLGRDDAISLIQSSPDLMHRTYISPHPIVFAMRTDKAELPYKDKRVRQALMMAIDWNSIVQDIQGGEGEILAFPISKAYQRPYMPLEEMPVLTQALFQYSPDKAKQLLSDAGFMDGFDVKVIVSPALLEPAMVYKEMWDKVGVELELQTREGGVYGSIVYTRAYEDMLLYMAIQGYPNFLNFTLFRGKTSWSYVNDSVIDKAYLEMQKHILVDMPGADALYRKTMPYVVEQAYYIPVPSPHFYTLWWPWLKNYHGEGVGLVKYFWIDQDIKEETTGRK